MFLDKQAEEFENEHRPEEEKEVEPERVKFEPLGDQGLSDSGFVLFFFSMVVISFLLIMMVPFIKKFFF